MPLSCEHSEATVGTTCRAPRLDNAKRALAESGALPRALTYTRNDDVHSLSLP